MAADKPPYKMTINLDSARPDALSQALEALRDIISDHDQTGEAESTIVIKSFKESPLLEVREAFEEWLWKYKIGIGCKIRLDSPGVRPESASIFRARFATPMDQAGWAKVDEATEEELEQANAPIIIEPPYEWREPIAESHQLSAPPIEAEIVDGFPHGDPPQLYLEMLASDNHEDEIDEQASEHERALDEAEEERRIAEEVEA